MKKYISSLLIIVALLLNVTSLSALENPSVTFDGTSSLKYNSQAHDFSQVFSGMVPSEARTLEIDLINDTNQTVDFFMSTKVLEAFEDAVKATQGAYNVSLSLLQDGKTLIIYGEDEGALIGANENGLYDLNGALNDKYMIANIDGNKQAKILLTIQLDGMSLRNEYQGLQGALQFDFTAQYPEVKTKQVVNTTVINKYVDSVKTGDPTSIGILVGVIVIAAIGITLTVKKGGKKHEK